MLTYPLTMSFKKIALNPQVRVTDGTGRLIAYGKQKAFKLKEDITIFQDEGQQVPLFRLRADRVFEMGAKYSIEDANGAALGSVQRNGMRSILKAQYKINNYSGMEIGTIHEENGWIKAADALFGEIPIAGMFAGYLFNPAYLVDSGGQNVLRAQKQPAFLEGAFKVTQNAEINPDDESLIIASTIMAMMLERFRG